MRAEQHDLHAIFNEAIALGSPEAQALFLDEACGSDTELRKKIEALLRAHSEAGGFFGGKSPAPAATEICFTAERAGTVIGPYKLLQQIGEGGMGVVYMAEQTVPVERRVALKIIKPGMDTQLVIARFEAERQALAMMEHPNIARVLDAGTTATGRPYFVMELVKGLPITQYCDEQHLAPRERLELFVPICQAVQHAHQKGIIHRDLKPSNILIARYDDKPVPKVIDFGIAKATSQKLTERTMFTQFGQLVGTIDYMSPEQAQFNQLDVDTRSDIYSLGVLLYELLTGETPFDRTRLRTAAFEELLRIIREEEPPRPSVKLSSCETLASVAANRHMEPHKLGPLVRGELDWIVMKALEKDRTRRYETANGFAGDVLRYLADEPVTACPPSTTYRLRKFARRNKVALATTTAVCVALVAGIIGTTWQAVRATREATRASQAEALAETRYTAEKVAREQADAARAAEREQRQVADQQRRIADEQKQAAIDAGDLAREKEQEALAALAEAERQRQRAEANFDEARRAVDEYLAQVTESQLLTVPGLQPLREDLLEAALTFYAKFTQERADDPTIQRELASAHYRLGRIYSELGDGEAAREANGEAIRLFEQLRDAGHFDREMQVALARAYFYSHRYDNVVSLCQDVLKSEPEHAEAASLLADTYNDLAVANKRSNDISVSLQYHQQAFELREKLVSRAPDNPRYLAQLGATLNNLGDILRRQGKLDQALPLFERAVEYLQQAYDGEPHSLLWGRWLSTSLGNVAATQASLRREQEALASYQRLVAVSRKRAFENPAVASLQGDRSAAHLSLARYQQQLGDTGEAARSFREAREVLENIPRETPDQLYELATVYAALAQPIAMATEPTEEEVAEQERNIELTLQTLHNAVEGGFSDVRKLRSERLFDVIRKRDEFQQIVTVLERAAKAEQLARRDSDSADQKLADRLRAAELLTDVVTEQPASLRHRQTLAATLHSIGVMQTGLKQFDEAEQSLRRAVEVWDTTQQLTPESQLDRLGTQIAMGRLYWDMGRHQEAHLLWKDLRTHLEEFQASHSAGETGAADKRLSEMVRPIAEAYTDVGLWEEAGVWLSAAGAESPAEMLRWDATVRLLLNDEAGYRTRCAQLVERSTRTTDAHDLHCIAAACLMSSQSYDDPVRWLQTSKEIAELKPEWTWMPEYVGLAHYRAGRFDNALDTLQSQKGSVTAYTLLAMTCQRRGAQADAQAWFDKAHAYYVRQVQSAVADDTAIFMNGVNHWERAQFQLLYREARSLGLGTAGPDPFNHLVQARSYMMIGEVERSEAELAAAATASLDDPDMRLVRARLFDQWDDFERAESDWQHAVDVAGDDPMPWIQRGRWYAERGEEEKSDADFAHAASLTPDELNTFLEAGWWIVGPYPANLDEICPPEIDHDPSQPVHVIDPQAGISDKAVAWRHVAGTTLGELSGRTDASTYALTYIYSPDERTELMRVGGDKPIRIWFNNQPVYAKDEARGRGIYQTRVPVALRPGRNVLLVKTLGETPSIVRLGDSPADRAYTFFEQGLWEEAAHAFLSDGGHSFSTDAKSWALLVQILALTGHEDDYNKQLKAIFDHAFRDAGDIGLKYIAMAASAGPNAVLEEHYEEIVERVESYLERDVRSEEVYHGFEAAAWGALQLDRTGDAERLLQLLDKELPGRKDNGHEGWPVRAVLAQRTGDHEEAQRWLKRCYDEYPQRVEWTWWPLRPLILLRLRTAERLITGSTEHSDAILREAREKNLREFEERDPLTAAFDHRVQSQPGNTAFPYLARGRRLAELGRMSEAEADFNKAVELAPDNVDVLLARARLHAERGDLIQAERDFESALTPANSAPPPENFALMRRIENELGRHDGVLTHWQDRTDHPHSNWLRRVRGQRQIQLGNWQAAADSLARADHWSHDGLLAPLYCLLGDADAFRKICEAQLSRMPAKWDEPGRDYYRMEMLSLLPSTEGDSRELTRLVHSRLPEFQNWRFAPLGAALYRNGRYDEALRVLNDYLGGQAPLQRDARAWPLLAMTHWQLGHHDEARTWLKRTGWWIEHFRRAADAPEKTGFHDADCRDWLYTNVFFAEAKALIEESSPAAREIRQPVVSEEPGRNQETSGESLANLRILSKDAPQNPHYHEQLARLLANCPDVTLRDREQALVHARRATELRPEYLHSAFGIFREAQCWTEATEFGVKLIERNPDCESWMYLPIAAVAVRATDRAAYVGVCSTMLQRFADSEDIVDAERVTKACLLWPGVFDSSTLPADRFTKALEDGTASDVFKPWGWAARALLAYRSGNPQAAVNCVARSEESAPDEFTQAMNLPVLALARHQLQQADEARTTLEEASQIITRLKDDPGKKGDAKLVIAELLFSEAKATINGNEAAEEEKRSASELNLPATSHAD